MPDNRIPTNQSQIEINTSIQALNTQITALNSLIADLGLVSITPISQADYDNLSPTDKLNGVFDIYDAVEPNIDGNKVLYDSNNTINDVVDELFGKKAVYTITKNGTRTYGDVMNLLYANVNFTINSKIVVNDGTTLDIYPISLWASTRKRFTRTIAGSGNSALEVVTWDIRNSNAKFSKTVVASSGTVTVTDLTSNIAETVEVYDLA